MTLPAKISPSIMCSKIEDYTSYLDVFDEVGIDSIHFDVMDGQFVPNIMLGTGQYADTKRLSGIPVHLHMMVDAPERAIEMFDVGPGETVFFHPETTNSPYKILEGLQERGVNAGIALNPGSPIVIIDELLEVLDAVLIMTVSPGFAGQEMVSNATRKIARTRELLEEKGKGELSIYVDGNTTSEKARLMRAAGADGFVVGTSSLMRSPDEFSRNYADYLKNLEGAS